MARFSLGQLLLFVFACCACLAVAGGLLSAEGKSEPSWQVAVLNAGVWLFLPVLYFRWRLVAAFAVHFAVSAVVFAGVFASIFLVIVVFLADANFMYLISIGAFWGCTLGTLISFPVAIVTISYRGIRKHDPPKLNWQQFSLRALLTALVVMPLFIVSVVVGWGLFILCMQTLFDMGAFA